MNAINLAGYSILVTRPKETALSLCEAIEKAHGQAIFYPTIEMIPCPPQYDEKHFLESDWFIFVSPIAVQMSIDTLKKKWPPHVKIAAIGDSTARALTKNNLSVDLIPPHWNSESLLMMPDMQSVQKKIIFIIGGEAGRTLLADTLKERGASVHHYVTYKRVCPSKKSLETKPDIIVCTSVTGLSNAVFLLDHFILDVPLLVVSDRQRMHAETLGFTNKILVSDNATDHAIMKKIKEWRETECQKI